MWVFCEKVRFLDVLHEILLRPKISTFKFSANFFLAEAWKCFKCNEMCVSDIEQSTFRGKNLLDKRCKKARQLFF